MGSEPPGEAAAGQVGGEGRSSGQESGPRRRGRVPTGLRSRFRSSCLRRVMAGHLVKPDARNCKRPRDLEPQMPDSPQLSSLGKSDSSFSESSGLFYKDEALEKDLNDLSKEINLMLSTYAKILSGAVNELHFEALAAVWYEISGPEVKRLAQQQDRLVLKKYTENTHQKKAIFSKRQNLPCIAPLLATVQETLWTSARV